MVSYTGASHKHSWPERTNVPTWSRGTTNKLSTTPLKIKCDKAWNTLKYGNDMTMIVMTAVAKQRVKTGPSHFKSCRFWPRWSLNHWRFHRPCALHSRCTSLVEDVEEFNHGHGRWDLKGRCSGMLEANTWHTWRFRGSFSPNQQVRLCKIER